MNNYTGFAVELYSETTSYGDSYFVTPNYDTIDSTHNISTILKLLTLDTINATQHALQQQISTHIYLLVTTPEQNESNHIHSEIIINLSKDDIEHSITVVLEDTLISVSILSYKPIPTSSLYTIQLEQYNYDLLLLIIKALICTISN